jgi:hypothetical protein
MISRYASLRQGLVGAWCPSLGASGFRLIDRSGYGNHGTLTNMDPGTDWVASGGKGALDFDNGDDSINCSHINAIDSGVFSVSFWYVPAFVTGFNQMFGQWNSIGIGPIAFRNGAAIAWQVGASGNRATSANVLSVGKWVHIVCIRDSVLRIAINGQMDAATATPGTQNNSEPFIIAGAIGGAGTGPGACGIDDFRIYNRALTPSEIQQLYTGGRGVGLIPERIKHRRKTTAAATNRRRRIICGANC